MGAFFTTQIKMRALLLLLSLGVSSFLTAQPTVIQGEVRHLTLEEERMDSANRHCIETNNYAPKQRLQNYPFNRAKQVQLLSFDMP